MSKRLQVVMDEDEYAAIEAAAQREGETVSQWVRSVLRTARGSRPKSEIARKLAVLREAALHEGPTGDIEQMLAETESGYRGELPG